MFGADTDTSPPEETFVFLYVVQKSVSDVLGRDLALFQQGPYKKERAVGIVVGSKDSVVFQIAFLITIFFPDLFVCPAFHISAQTYADDLAQPAAVGFGEIFPVVVQIEFLIGHFRTLFSSIIHKKEKKKARVCGLALCLRKG